MRRSAPFSSAISIAQAIAAASSPPEQFRLADTPYCGRSKGPSGHSGKKQGNPGTPWLARLKGKTNGDREIFRRLQQIENGILKPN